MAYATHGHAPAASLRSTHWLLGVFDAWHRLSVERRTYAELSSLSDRELDDLGLSRASLRDVARNAAAGV